MHKKIHLGLVFSVALLASSTSFSDVTIDLTNAGVQVSGSNSIRINNLNVTGAGKFTADLVWDAKSLVFVPIKAAVDTSTKFKATNYVFSFDNGSFSDSPASVCQREHGLAYGLADWTDLVAALKSSSDLNTFLNSIGDTGRQGVAGSGYYLSYKGASFKDKDSAYYAFAYSDSTWYTIFDSILGGTLKVAYGSNRFKAICVNKSI